MMSFIIGLHKVKVADTDIKDRMEMFDHCTNSK